MTIAKGPSSPARSRALLACLCSLCATLAPSLPAADSLPQLALKPAFPNIPVNRPLCLEEAPDGTGRLFLAEQSGRILILPKDRQSAETVEFLNIVPRRPFVENEEGLLGFAFHPEFKTNRKFYIYYTQQSPRRSVISEFQAAAGNSDQADLSSERLLMEIPQPYWNHNGGQLLFGPDGFLYITSGDGGSGNDPHGFGQNLRSMLGKILRIDVNASSEGRSYGIPRDNPFVDEPGARPEIYALGLRNIWRMSFDRETGELWAGDVGQNKWEEVDLIVKGGNYGWNYREGFHEFHGEPPAKAKLLDPVIEYPHTDQQESVIPHSPGLSITGGYVYRGKKLPALRGTYLYADFALGTFWGLRHRNGRVTEHSQLLSQPKNVASFAEDRSGELYILMFDAPVSEFEVSTEDASSAK